LEEKFSVYPYSEAEENMDKSIEAHDRYTDITKIFDDFKGLFLEELMEKMNDIGSSDKKITVYKKVESLIKEGYIAKEKKGNRNFYSVKNQKK